MPSYPGASSFSPFKTAAVKLRRMPRCASSPSERYSLYSNGILQKLSLLVIQTSRSSASSRQCFKTPSSTTILPLVPEISSRFVPGNSPVEVINTPLAPFAKRVRIIASSSTSILWYFAVSQSAETATGIPQIHCQRSRLWGA